MTAIEDLFIQMAEKRLPVGEARVSRTEHGILSYSWQSPCSEVEALSVFIRDGEIVLWTKITHWHIDRAGLRHHPDVVEDRHVVEKSIAQIARILAGETTFSRTYDLDGRQHSSGIGELGMQDEEVERYREVFGEGFTTRTWNWFGEVSSKKSTH